MDLNADLITSMCGNLGLPGLNFIICEIGIILRKNDMKLSDLDSMNNLHLHL